MTMRDDSESRVPSRLEGGLGGGAAAPPRRRPMPEVEPQSDEEGTDDVERPVEAEPEPDPGTDNPPPVDTD